MDFFERTNLLIDTENLKNKTVAIFGLGGVGCYVVEGLVRAGIHSFVLIDYDTIALSNINRHLLAFLVQSVRKKRLCKRKNFKNSTRC